MADEVVRLSGEERIDAIVLYLKEKHGFHFPEELLPEQPVEEEGTSEVDENGDPVEPQPEQEHHDDQPE